MQHLGAKRSARVPLELSPLRSGVVIGSCYAAMHFAADLIFGEDVTPVGTAIRGLMFGGAFAYLASRRRTQLDIRQEDLRRVADAVRDGTDIGDPELAQATIRLAQIRQRAFGHPALNAVVLVLLLGGGVVGLVQAAQAGAPLVVGFWVALLATLLVAFNPRGARRMVRNASQAEQFAAERLHRPLFRPAEPDTPATFDTIFPL